MMERKAWRGRIVDGMKAEYKRRHDEIWPEMKQVLKNPMHRTACKQLRLGQLPMKWRVYYLLVKTRLTLPVFLMTKVIRFIQRKG